MQKNIMNSEEWRKQDRRYHEDTAVAESYDKKITRKYLLEHKYFTLDKWVEELEKSKKKMILDFGCGTGTITLKLLKRDIKTISIDASLEMAKELQRKAEENMLNSICVVGDAENLPFKDEVFDGLVCAGVLHHLPDVEKGVENQMHVLKKNGLLFITEPFKCKPWFSYPYYISIMIARFVLGLFRKSKFKPQERLMSKSDLESISALLRNKGFEFTITYFVYWPIICGCLPESIAYPLTYFLNKMNRGSSRGDSFIIKAKKI